MVKGLDIFREFFAAYSGQYVLIGGTAASLAMEEAGLEFRATKDLDIVLYVEGVSPEFGRAFWSFIESGGYEIRESSSGNPVFYRFQKPSIESFPAMLELFSRAPNGIELAPGSHLTPIPVDEEVSSLSAILLDDDYYRFVMDQHREADGLSWVGAECLIPLKASAWLDLSARRERGEKVDSKAVNKHRNDVVHLSQLLAPAKRVKLAPKIYEHLSQFLARLDADASFDPKSVGVANTRKEIISRIDQAYDPTEATKQAATLHRRGFNAPGYEFGAETASGQTQ